MDVETYSRTMEVETAISPFEIYMAGTKQKIELHQGLNMGACGAGTPVVEDRARVVTRSGRTYETQNYRPDVLRDWLDRGDFADHERIFAWKYEGCFWRRRRIAIAIKPSDVRRVR